jgi:hypothetical protein
VPQITSWLPNLKIGMQEQGGKKSLRCGESMEHSVELLQAPETDGSFDVKQ